MITKDFKAGNKRNRSSTFEPCNNEKFDRRERIYETFSAEVESATQLVN